MFWVVTVLQWSDDMWFITLAINILLGQILYDLYRLDYFTSLIFSHLNIQRIGDVQNDHFIVYSFNE